MCLIIDANCAAETLCANPNEEFAPIIEAIMRKKAVIVIGGSKQRAEYQKLASVWRFIVALDRAGRALTVSTATVDKRQQELEASGLLLSDDPHIVALAQVSGARLLCSKDQNLHKDFLSKELIDKPRGKVYQNKSHTPLIRQCCAI